MSLNTINSAALSGLLAAQTAMTTVSNNVANVNTPGYVREVVNQSAIVSDGIGQGVTVDGIERVANQYLESAGYIASAQSAQAGVVSNTLTQAETSFGDPSSATSYLNQISSVFSAFTTAANDPASSLSRSQALAQVTTFLNNTQTVATSLSGLTQQSDSQITSDVTQANQLLGQINTLNSSIVSATAGGADASGAQDSQSQLLGQLSSLLTINVTTAPNGAVVVRSATGVPLVGVGNPATLSYTPSNNGAGVLSISTPGSGQTIPFSAGSGEIAGLISLRNVQIPGIQDQLSALVGGTVNAINAASNASSAVPPPATLTGTNTGQDLPTAITGFTGTTNVAIVNSSGMLQQQVAINFSAQTMSVNGAAPTGFTPATFLASLNGALGTSGSASYNNGVLSISATGAGNGVAIADTAGAASQKTGEGFSQYFGLNDVITPGQISNNNTGLTAASANGFTPGGQITLRLSDGSGSELKDVTVTVPPASSPSMTDLMTALNDPANGVGQFGSFSLNANGALTFAPTTPGAASVSVVADNTQRGAGGPSMTQFFGIGAEQQASTASTYQIRSDIVNNPMNLPLAQLNLANAASGQPVLDVGDGSGATAIGNAATTQIGFPAAGTFPASTTTVNQYASLLAGSLGSQASAAASAQTAAAAVQTEASTRLQSVEGVNLDQELTSLTTYQQAYSASARLLQAVTDMFTALIAVVP